MKKRGFFHQLTNPWVSYRQPIGYLPTEPPIIGFLTTSGYITINHKEVGIFPSINQPLGILLTTYWISSQEPTIIGFLTINHQPTSGYITINHKEVGIFRQLLTNPWVSYQQPIGYLATKTTIIGFLTINHQPTSGHITINHEEAGIFPSINQPLGILPTTYWISSHRTTNHWVSYNQRVYYHQP